MTVIVDLDEGRVILQMALENSNSATLLENCMLRLKKHKVSERVCQVI
jgi:hypothetical protein